MSLSKKRIEENFLRRIFDNVNRCETLLNVPPCDYAFLSVGFADKYVYQVWEDIDATNVFNLPDFNSSNLEFDVKDDLRKCVLRWKPTGSLSKEEKNKAQLVLAKNWEINWKNVEKLCNNLDLNFDNVFPPTVKANEKEHDLD